MAQTDLRVIFMNNIQIQRLSGDYIQPYVSELANLRITVFREYPYLYEGQLDYEQKYLQTYLNSPNSTLILAKDTEKNKIIGASTAIPLSDETPEVQDPFLKANMDIANIFYFGESILLPAYRGKGVYRHFFLEREKAAKEYGAELAVFCGVERGENHPLKPVDYKPLDKIWQRFGFSKHPELQAQYEWKDLTEETPSFKPMIFWLKKL